jgi:hypothetical protein
MRDSEFYWECAFWLMTSIALGLIALGEDYACAGA